MPVVKKVKAGNHLRRKLRRALEDSVPNDDSGWKDNMTSKVESMVEETKASADKVYQDLIRKTLDLRLDQLVTSSMGNDLFSELCLRVDLNQKYVDILPQVRLSSTFTVLYSCYYSIVINKLIL